jgi:uncharacterized protein (TIGR02145 family)
MKNSLFVLILFCVLNVNAQNHLISFEGTGAATAVNTVTVMNLTAGTSRTINGDDILRLTSTVGISDVDIENLAGIKIYPNPMTDRSKLLISAPEAGDAVISVYDISGRQLSRIKSYIQNYTQEFTLSGLKNGFYIINVKGNTYQFSGNVISNGKSDGITRIEKVSENIAVDRKVTLTNAKGVMATIDMEYTTGDRLLFMGTSGIYSTVVTEIPDADKTITFDFVPCTDGDGNNYPVVNINGQTWMAENLKTTQYNDGTDIPLVTDNTAWSSLITPGYEWYNYDPSYKNAYGAIYNWYAVNTGKLCPSGWIVPTDDDWIILLDYLGGESVAGGKIKATGTDLWYPPNSSATNETGFTGNPGGYRSPNGAFVGIRYYGSLWSATGYDVTWAGGGFTSYNNGEVTVGEYNKKYGFSVRCIKDK